MFGVSPNESIALNSAATGFTADASSPGVSPGEAMCHLLGVPYDGDPRSLDEAAAANWLAQQRAEGKAIVLPPTAPTRPTTESRTQPNAPEPCSVDLDALIAARWLEEHPGTEPRSREQAMADEIAARD